MNGHVNVNLAAAATPATSKLNPNLLSPREAMGCPIFWWSDSAAMS